MSMSAKRSRYLKSVGSGGSIIGVGKSPIAYNRSSSPTQTQWRSGPPPATELNSTTTASRSYISASPSDNSRSNTRRENQQQHAEFSEEVPITLSQSLSDSIASAISNPPPPPPRRGHNDDAGYTLDDQERYELGQNGSRRPKNDNKTTPVKNTNQADVAGRRSPAWSRYLTEADIGGHNHGHTQKNLNNSFEEVHKGRSTDSGTSNGNESVAARRRRKAMAAGAYSKGNGGAPNSNGGSTMYSPEKKISDHYSQQQQQQHKQQQQQQQQQIHRQRPQQQPRQELDPPLILYESDDESTDMENEDLAAINGDKKKGSKGFFKVKKFIRMGTSKSRSRSNSPVRTRSKSPVKGRSAEVVIDRSKLKSEAYRTRSKSPTRGSRSFEVDSVQTGSASKSNNRSSTNHWQVNDREHERELEDRLMRDSGRGTSPSRRNLADKFHKNGVMGIREASITSEFSNDVSEMTNPTYLGSRSTSHTQMHQQPQQQQRQEFQMKEAPLPKQMKERSGTPSESESSFDQSESGAPLIEAKDSAAFGTSFFGEEPSSDQPFTSTFTSMPVKDAKDPFQDPFFTDSQPLSSSSQFSRTMTDSSLHFPVEEESFGSFQGESGSRNGRPRSQQPTPSENSHPAPPVEQQYSTDSGEVSPSEERRIVAYQQTQGGDDVRDRYRSRSKSRSRSPSSRQKGNNNNNPRQAHDGNYDGARPRARRRSKSRSVSPNRRRSSNNSDTSNYNEIQPIDNNGRAMSPIYERPAPQSQYSHSDENRNLQEGESADSRLSTPKTSPSRRQGEDNSAQNGSMANGRSINKSKVQHGRRMARNRRERNGGTQAVPATPTPTVYSEEQGERFEQPSAEAVKGPNSTQQHPTQASRSHYDRSTPPMDHQHHEGHHKSQDFQSSERTPSFTSSRNGDSRGRGGQDARLEQDHHHRLNDEYNSSNRNSNNNNNNNPKEFDRMGSRQNDVNQHSDRFEDGYNRHQDAYENQEYAVDQDQIHKNHGQIVRLEHDDNNSRNDGYDDISRDRQHHQVNSGRFPLDSNPNSLSQSVRFEQDRNDIDTSNSRALTRSSHHEVRRVHHGHDDENGAKRPVSTHLSHVNGPGKGRQFGRGNLNGRLVPFDEEVENKKNEIALQSSSSSESDKSKSSGRSARAAARRNTFEQKAKDELIKYSSRDSIGQGKMNKFSGSPKLLPGSLSPTQQQRKQISPPRGRQRTRVEVQATSSSGLASNGRGDTNPTFLRKEPTPLRPKRKPYCKATLNVFASSETAIAFTSDITDPIQRAGVRLLSAAAVPIQTEIRRFLSKRNAEDRLWALTVLQSYFRRWKAETVRFETLYSVTKIQACFRGWLLRDTLEDENFCAAEIQKIARGYLATMQVYEDLYNITVVQSIARRRVAIITAKARSNALVTIQSIRRGIVVRRDLTHQAYYASMIQSCWRGYSAQLTYQFDIVDIIIVQSVFRRRAAQRLYDNKLYNKHTEAAIVIQTAWRTYDCTMTYLHSIADVLIAQSVVRRWIAMRFVPEYRSMVHNNSALVIQTVVRGWSARVLAKEIKSSILIQNAWRGFQCYIDFIFTMADIVIVQRTVRQRLAVKQVESMREDRYDAIEKAAATMIQKIWRGYHAHMGMLFTLVHIIVAQSVMRRRLAIVQYIPIRTVHRAAIDLQKNFRRYIVRRDFIEYTAARMLQASIRGFAARNVYNEYKGARTIQAQVRTMIALRDMGDYKAARGIQAWYRCQSVRHDYVVFISARRIQSQWRGFEARRAVGDELWLRDDAAISIQKCWRMFYQCSNYTIISFEKHAATTIQKHWRGFWQFSHYIILRFEIIRIQAFVRACLQRKDLRLQNDCATIMQSTARCFLAKKNCHMERLITAMVQSASLSLSTRLASKRIQRWYRARISFGEEKKAALIIERFFIWVRREVEEEIERREKIKLVKRKKQRRRRNDEEDTLLESVWNGTLGDLGGKSISGNKREKGKSKGRRKKNGDTNKSRVGEEKSQMSRSKDSRKKNTTKKSRSVKENRQEEHDKEEASNPTRFSYYDPNDEYAMMRPPTASVHMEKDCSDTHSDVSGITTPSVFVSPLSRLKQKNQDTDDFDLEEAWANASVKASTSNAGKNKNRLQRNRSISSTKENDASPDRSRRKHRDLLRR